MNRKTKGLIFFIGWILSPFTWWNDAFVNIPLSYLAASIIYYFIHISFVHLVTGLYWVTNILGLALMYVGGRSVILSSKNRAKTIFYLVIFTFLYSALMVYLDRLGKLKPLGEYFRGIFKYAVT